MSESRLQFPPERISGAALRALAALSQNRVAAAAIEKVFAAQLGLDRLAALPAEDRGALTPECRALQARPPRGGPLRHDGPPAEPRWPVTSAGLVEGYQTRRVTPREVVERALAEARRLDAEAGPVAGGPVLDLDEAGARRDAEASSRRWAAGAPLGPLDGIPTVIKEETAVFGLPARCGTSWLPATPSKADATAVARLRAAGAIVLGSTAMTELGMSPLGANPHRRMPRNPHDPTRIAGGSSTGSAVSVAVGLCPVALGADGGGSIRIPASICGVYGLKPTFGRVSRAGDFYGGTMNHLGPIGASPGDLAAFLEVAAGAPDPLDPSTMVAPAGSEWRAGSDLRPLAALMRGAAGLTIGVLDSLWADADDEVAHAGRSALAALERAGARLKPVTLGLAEASPAIGYLTIGLEELADLAPVLRARRAAIGADLQVSMAALSAQRANAYLDAQRLRARLREQARAAFAEVDLIALPAASIVAAPISDAESQSGILDAAALHGVCRTMMLGNLTGLPAGTAPVGRSRSGLPIGLQLIGDAWDEATVIAALAELQRTGAAEVRRPQVHVGSLAGG